MPHFKRSLSLSQVYLSFQTFCDPHNHGVIHFALNDAPTPCVWIVRIRLLHIDDKINKYLTHINICLCCLASYVSRHTNPISLSSFHSASLARFEAIASTKPPQHQVSKENIIMCNSVFPLYDTQYVTHNSLTGHHDFSNLFSLSGNWRKSCAPRILY